MRLLLPLARLRRLPRFVSLGYVAGYIPTHPSTPVAALCYVFTPFLLLAQPRKALDKGPILDVDIPTMDAAAICARYSSEALIAYCGTLGIDGSGTKAVLSEYVAPCLASHADLREARGCDSLRMLPFLQRDAPSRADQFPPLGSPPTCVFRAPLPPRRIYSFRRAHDAYLKAQPDFSPLALRQRLAVMPRGQLQEYCRANNLPFADAASADELRAYAFGRAIPYTAAAARGVFSWLPYTPAAAPNNLLPFAASRRSSGPTSAAKANLTSARAVFVAMGSLPSDHPSVLALRGSAEEEVAKRDKRSLDVWDVIVHEIAQRAATSTTELGASLVERPVEREELFAWIGVSMLMGLVVVPEIKAYWSDSALFGIAAVARVMSRCACCLWAVTAAAQSLRFQFGSFALRCVDMLSSVCFFRRPARLSAPGGSARGPGICVRVTFPRTHVTLFFRATHSEIDGWPSSGCFASVVRATCLVIQKPRRLRGSSGIHSIR